jgi:uncharacterized membrane protein YphA (DoxX/SURF4 family)
MLAMTQDSVIKTTIVPLILRLTLAVIFLYHGLAKVGNAEGDFGANWAAAVWRDAGRAPDDVMKKLREISDSATGTESEKEAYQAHIGDAEMKILSMYKTPPVPESLHNHAVQFAVAWGELLGGAALLAGALTRFAAAGLLIIQIGAIAIVTSARGFSFTAGGGYEYNLTLLAMCLVLILIGGGKLSVDHVFTKRRKRKTTATTAPAAKEPTAAMS